MRSELPQINSSTLKQLPEMYNGYFAKLSNEVPTPEEVPIFADKTSTSEIVKMVTVGLDLKGDMTQVNSAIDTAKTGFTFLKINRPIDKHLYSFPAIQKRGFRLSGAPQLTTKK